MKNKQYPKIGSIFLSINNPWQAGICLIAMLLLSVAACSSPSSTEPEEFDMELDLETLTAETESGTLYAERVENSFIGPLGEGQAIGIAFLSDVGIETADELQDGIIVYLYDRENFTVMIGELDAEGATTLESEEEFSDFNATADFAMEDDVVSGTVTFRDEEPTSFTAEAAAGVGGVYWAAGTEENPDISGDWVVLPDERQWGCVCCCSYTSRCCAVRL